MSDTKPSFKKLLNFIIKNQGSIASLKAAILFQGISCFITVQWTKFWNSNLKWQVITLFYKVMVCYINVELKMVLWLPIKHFLLSCYDFRWPAYAIPNTLDNQFEWLQIFSVCTKSACVPKLPSSGTIWGSSQIHTIFSSVKIEKDLNRTDKPEFLFLDKCSSSCKPQ